MIKTICSNKLLHVSFIALFICVMFATGCQTTNPDHQTIVKLSKDLDESNKKIDELYHRVSVVQFMADNHERILTGLKKTDSSDKAESTANPVKKPPSPEPEKALPKDKTESTDTPNKEEKIERTDNPVVTAEEVDKTPETPIDKTSIDKKSDKKDIVSEKEKKSEEKKEIKTIAPTPDIPKKSSDIASLDKESPEFIYNQGFAALKNKNYSKAETLFKTVVTKYPKNSLAVNSVYWTGEIYYSQNNFKEAINTFNKLIETYPDGSKVPDALLKIGYSYYSLKDKNNAIKYLKKVMVDYPFSTSAGKAETMLGKIE